MSKKVENSFNYASAVAVGIAAGIVARGLVTAGNLFYVAIGGWLMFAVALMVVLALYRKFQNQDDNAEKKQLKENLDFYRDNCSMLMDNAKRLVELNEDINAINKDVIDTNKQLFDDLSDIHVVVNELLERIPDPDCDDINSALSSTRYYFNEDDGKYVLYIRRQEEKK